MAAPGPGWVGVGVGVWRCGGVCVDGARASATDPGEPASRRPEMTSAFASAYCLLFLPAHFCLYKAESCTGGVNQGRDEGGARGLRSEPGPERLPRGHPGRGAFPPPATGRTRSLRVANITPAAAKALLDELTGLDGQLYAYARTLFVQQLQRCTCCEAKWPQYA